MDTIKKNRPNYTMAVSEMESPLKWVVLWVCWRYTNRNRLLIGYMDG